MREKHTKKQQPGTESFWGEIGNWGPSVFIVDLSALKINK